MAMASVIQATAARQAERVSDLSVVTVFSLVGIVLSLVAAHLGFDLGMVG
jgi:hypothetical protein